MARLSLSTPPNLGPNAKYGDYKPWLLENFFRDICSYCLQQYGSLTVEHYVPQSYDASLEHDASNLLLGCWNCQRKKWDYHPDHATRRCKKGDKTGFMVLNVLEDDLALMFELQDNGELLARSGAQEARAVWNAQLLRLDFYDENRGRLLEKLRVAEGLLSALEAGQIALDDRIRAALDVLVLDLAEQLPFLTAFNVSPSTLMGERIHAVIAAR